MLAIFLSSFSISRAETIYIPYSVSLSSRFPGISASTRLPSGYIHCDIRYENEILPTLIYGRQDKRFEMKIGSILNTSFENKLIEYAFFRSQALQTSFLFRPIKLMYHQSDFLRQFQLFFFDTIGLGLQDFSSNKLKRETVSVSIKKEVQLNKFLSKKWYSPIQHFNTVQLNGHYYLFNFEFEKNKGVSKKGYNTGLKFPLPFSNKRFQHAVSLETLHFEGIGQHPNVDYFLFSFHESLFNSQFLEMNINRLGYKTQFIDNRIRIFGSIEKISPLESHFLSIGFENKISSKSAISTKLFYSSEEDLLIYIGFFASLPDVRRLPHHLNRLLLFFSPQF